MRAVALELGIPPNILRRWIKHHDAQDRQKVTRRRTHGREAARLASQKEALREENEILKKQRPPKKAAAFLRPKH